MANPSKDAAIFMDFERSRSWNLNRELEILKRRAECERIEEYPDTESPDFFFASAFGAVEASLVRRRRRRMSFLLSCARGDKKSWSYSNERRHYMGGFTEMPQILRTRPKCPF